MLGGVGAHQFSQEMKTIRRRLATYGVMESNDVMSLN